MGNVFDVPVADVPVPPGANAAELDLPYVTRPSPWCEGACQCYALTWDERTGNITKTLLIAPPTNPSEAAFYHRTQRDALRSQSGDWAADGWTDGDGDRFDLRSGVRVYVDARSNLVLAWQPATDAGRAVTAVPGIPDRADPDLIRLVMRMATRRGEDCSVCFERTELLRLPACGHLCICAVCLTGMINIDSNVQCPICRTSQSMDDLLPLERLRDCNDRRPWRPARRQNAFAVRAAPPYPVRSLVNARTADDYPSSLRNPPPSPPAPLPAQPPVGGTRRSGGERELVILPPADAWRWSTQPMPARWTQTNDRSRSTTELRMLAWLHYKSFDNILVEQQYRYLPQREFDRRLSELGMLRTQLIRIRGMDEAVKDMNRVYRTGEVVQRQMRLRRG